MALRNRITAGFSFLSGIIFLAAGFQLPQKIPEGTASAISGQDEINLRFEHLEKDFDYLRKEYISLKAETEVMKSENIELKAEKLALEGRVEYLEAITRVNVPRTCQDLKNLGVTRSGEYLIDPDGPGLGDPAFMAECNMSDGSTSIRHKIMEPADVVHCEDPGCHVSQIKYTATDKQINALAELSEKCSQAISYECFSAALTMNGVHNAWWLDSTGKPNYYWDGNHASTDHVCACDAENTCIIEGATCNCDSAAQQWLEDAGTLTNQAVLPVKELRFGGLTSDGQAAKFQLGAFQCKGRKEFSSAESCESLQKSGQLNSGYYVMDGTNGANFDLVKCNMQKNPGDPGFQEPTGVKLAKQHPVAFDIYRRAYYSMDNTIISYHNILVNIGGGISSASEGVFTAPVDGVYMFTLNFDEDPAINDDEFQIRKNGQAIATIFSGHANDAIDNSSSGEAVIVQLAKGDKVDTFLVKGGTGGEADTHFTGHLLFLL